MNDKYKQYLNIKNDKNLIQKHVLTEYQVDIFNKINDLKLYEIKSACIGTLFPLVFVTLFFRNSYSQYNLSFIDSFFCIS